ncbi:MAG: dTMP kinase [Thermoplasmatales archaeon]|nr:dTMP kinase [Thermoplasmatales archaeon]
MEPRTGRAKRRLTARGRALYVALEGIDGAGKSTVQRRVARLLRREGWRVRTRCEPSDRALGRYAQSAGAAAPWTGAIFFTIDRYLALPTLREDLKKCDLVLGDRSFWSTMAYQGSALPRADRRRLLALQRDSTVAPDLVVWLDLPVSAALARLGRRRTRAPLERRRTLRRVALAYRSLAGQSNWRRFEARQPARALAEEIARTIRRAGSFRVTGPRG